MDQNLSQNLNPNQGQLRSRLLELSSIHTETGAKLVEHLTKQSIAQVNRDYRKARLMIDGFSNGKISGKNEATRDAELRIIIAEDIDYNAYDSQCRDCAVGIEDMKLALRTIEFEAQILLAVYPTVIFDSISSRLNATQDKLDRIENSMNEKTIGRKEENVK